MTFTLPWKDLPPPRQTHFDWCHTPLETLLHEIKEEFFPHLPDMPQVTFCKLNTLACIVPGKTPPVIYLSSLLSHPAVPLEALTHILKHELLHLEIQGREVDGKYRSHPPEFWVRENEVSGVGSEFWLWVRVNFPGLIKVDTEREKTHLLKKAYRIHCAPIPPSDAAISGPISVTTENEREWYTTAF